MPDFAESLRDAVRVFQSLPMHHRSLTQAAEWCIQALRGSGKLLLCGNGGSASEAQHLAGELMGRYKENRKPLAAIALASDAAVLTCIGNDFCFDDIFGRQVRALGRAGDVLIVFTTSGNSPNVLDALRTAREMDVRSVSFLGNEGGDAKDLSDCPIVVGHRDTARVQEAHQFLMHCLMDQIEAGVAARP
ncbi:MAG: SIS domain-containing protein [Acidobacteriaceae bacterium]|nr:SIS domain-containing protein [Acidobacteriaceae bacterium]